MKKNLVVTKQKSTLSEMKNTSSFIVGQQLIELKPIKDETEFNTIKRLLEFSNRTDKKIDIDEGLTEHVIINDVLYILHGSSSITLSDAWGEVSIQYLDTYKVGYSGLPILFVNMSNFTGTIDSEVKGVNIINDSNVSVKQGYKFNQLIVVSSSLNAISAKLNYCRLVGCHLNANIINLLNTWLDDCNLYATTRIKIKQLCQKNIVVHNNGSVNAVEIEPNHTIYRPQFKIPVVQNKSPSYDVNIQTRIDYGTFSCINDISFARANECDIIIEGAFLSYDEIAELYDVVNKMGCRPLEDVAYNEDLLVRFLTCAFRDYEEKDIIKKTISCKLYTVTAKNLIAQIRSRTMLYNNFNKLIQKEQSYE